MKLTKEQIIAEELKAENLELREAVTRYTVELEYKNRELDIESSLERIRSHAMAMRDSGDLSVAAGMVFSELKKLGIHPFRSGVGLLTGEPLKALLYAAMEGPDYDALVLVGPIDLSAHKCMALQYESCLKQENYFPVLEAKEFQSYFAALADQIPVPSLAESQFQQTHYGYYFPFKEGYFYTWTEAPYITTEISLLERFKAIIALTFRRYLDLQKAEAQAREAQIELSLERVRARTMTMHKSDELVDTSVVLFQELRTLGVKAIRTGVAIIDDKKELMELWSSQLIEQKQNKVLGIVPMNAHPFFEGLLNAWRQNDTDFIYEFEGEKVKEFYQAMSSIITYPAQVNYNPCEVFSPFFFPEGSLTVVSHNTLSDEERNIMQRFARVFGLLYRRFLDLQKAEAQAKEAQIELGLERVRARTMAMQKSDELREAVLAIYEQLKLLNFESNACNIIIIDKESRNAQYWVSGFSKEIYPVSYNVPYLDHPYFDALLKPWMQGVKYVVYEYSGKMKQSFDEIFFTQTDFRNVPGEAKKIMIGLKSLKLSTAFISYGALQVLGPEPLSEENSRILQRFGKVFEQTYTRFLDLQKAEAQAREAQIELGLERVRARAMAMQKSDELSELVDTVFKELTKLDFALTWCIINIIDESSMSNTVWAANPDINKAPESYYMLFEDYPFHHAMMKGWKERKTKCVYTLEGSEKKIYDDYLFSETEFKRTPEAAQAASRAMEKYVVSFSFSNFGGLQTVGDVPLSDANLDILSRFGKVFDLTYTRFNDLKQAEAQAREAQIEAALERVRSRAMAMHKTDELLDAAELVHRELSALGINSMNVSYAFVDESEKYTCYYSLNPVDNKIPPFPFIFPNTETDVMRSILASWQKQEPFHVIELDEVATLEHQTYIGKLIQENFAKRKIDTPFSVEAFLEVSPKNAMLYTFNFKNGYLFNIGGQRLTKEQEKLLLRFTKVFEQTYTRFLDLQKAEAQAREAQIENALEKVRSRTMAMQKSEELPEAANVLFLQVQSLGIPAWSCGYNILAADKKSSTCIMSSEGEIQVPFVLPLTEHWSLLPWYEAIKDNLDFFVYEQGGEDLKEHYNYLASVPGLEKVFQQFEDAGISLPTHQFNHLVRFTNGFLLFITYESVPHAHDIFKRFGNVFEQTYTRFLDLQKAEAQAREAQIEAALERVRSRTMAMQSSSELGAVAAELFAQMNQLVTNLWTCGFVLCEKNRDEDEWWLSMDGDFTRGFFLPNIDDYTHATLYEGWLKGDALRAVQLDGEKLQQHYDWLMEIPVSRAIFEEMDAAGLARPDWQKLHAAYFSKGYLVIITREPCGEEEIFKRFAQVFDQTYTRFLDLKKAEAQTREAKIEAALERTRTQSMLMQHSNELDNTLRVFHHQVLLLGIHSAFSFLWLPDEKKDRHIFWAAWEENNSFKSKAVNYPLDRKESATAQCLVDWKSDEPVHSYHVNPADVDNYFAAWKELLDGVERLKPEYFRDGLYYVEAFMKYGCFGVMVENELAEDEKKILLRFAIEFERTYTRFLDLQKAEAQAREAQIEAGLERVRSRAMAMHKSEELTEAGGLLYKELSTLGLENLTTGYVLFNENATIGYSYGVNPMTGSIRHLPVGMPHNETWVMKSIVESWRKQEPLLVMELDPEETKAHQTFIAERSSNFPISVEQLLSISPERLKIHVFNFSQGYLLIVGGTLLTGAQQEMVIRFAKVFEQTYTRFLDLQKAEAQGLRAEQDLIEIKVARKKAEEALHELQETQQQLIQSEKMASLGELTAGIAHEIQNPLNFVNNFSEVNKELLSELKDEINKGNTDEILAIANDIILNEEKIYHHGKRADAIVKGMLQHSRSSNGQKEPTDINALADEYLRLAYHGLRAKEPRDAAHNTFNASFKSDFDESIGKISIIPQDIGRVILNLITNAFYAVGAEALAKAAVAVRYEPIVTVSTKKSGNNILISVKDNGNGIPQKILDKIFQPFFTTKPTGQGTGLGLSLSYDIVKAHGGEIKVNTREKEGTEFTIVLPA